MPIQPTASIWHNGKLIPWDQANIHVMSHVVHYGSSVFEGIRCYTPGVFRLQEHMTRLLDSAKIYRMPLPYTAEQLSRRRRRRHRSQRRRAMLHPPHRLPRLRRDRRQSPQGPDRCLHRQLPLGQVRPRQLRRRRLRLQLEPSRPQHHAVARQGWRQLHELAAHPHGGRINGYDEGIALDVNGYLSEGSGENLFLVRNGVLYTTPLANSVLSGITRSSIITLAKTTRHRSRRAGAPPRDALHRRRSLLHRHRRRSHPSALGRPHRHRRRQHGPHHHRPPQGFLRHRQRPRSPTNTTGSPQSTSA